VSTSAVELYDSPTEMEDAGNRGPVVRGQLLVSRIIGNWKFHMDGNRIRT
jgi:hypothetical protein